MTMLKLTPILLLTLLAATSSLVESYLEISSVRSRQIDIVVSINSSSRSLDTTLSVKCCSLGVGFRSPNCVASPLQNATEDDSESDMLQFQGRCERLMSGVTYLVQIVDIQDNPVVRGVRQSTKPLPVVGLRVSETTINSIEVKWNESEASSVVQFYNVTYIAQGQSSKKVKVRRVPGTKNVCNVTGLDDNTDYVISVTSISNNQYARPSLNVTARTKRKVTQIPVPVNLAVAKLGTRQLTLTWKFSENVSEPLNQYKFLVSFQSRYDKFYATDNTSDNSITLSELLPGTQYNIFVRTVLNNRTSRPSKEISLYTDDESPSAPRKLRFSKNTITWERPFPDRGRPFSYLLQVVSSDHKCLIAVRVDVDSDKPTSSIIKRLVSDSRKMFNTSLRSISESCTYGFMVSNNSIADGDTMKWDINEAKLLQSGGEYFVSIQAINRKGMGQVAFVKWINKSFFLSPKTIAAIGAGVVLFFLAIFFLAYGIIRHKRNARNKGDLTETVHPTIHVDNIRSTPLVGKWWSNRESAFNIEENGEIVPFDNSECKIDEDKTAITSFQ